MNKHISERVSVWLAKNDFSEKLLAARLGLSRSALSNRLNGLTDWKWMEVIEIANTLDCSLNELAGIETA